jgi:hypothetical protein
MENESHFRPALSSSRTCSRGRPPLAKGNPKSTPSKHHATDDTPRPSLFAFDDRRGEPNAGLKRSTAQHSNEPFGLAISPSISRPQFDAVLLVLALSFDIINTDIIHHRSS